jgi:hypothetical protein
MMMTKYESILFDALYQHPSGSFSMEGRFEVSHTFHLRNEQPVLRCILWTKDQCSITHLDQLCDRISYYHKESYVFSNYELKRKGVESIITVDDITNHSGDDILWF